MHEIKRSASFVVGEGYGNLIWSIRGIYEGYAGWFDMLPATMYDVPMAAVFPISRSWPGGAEPVTKLASQYVEAGRLVEALHLTEVALASDPQLRPALETRLKALGLRAKSKNSNERGWLDYHIRLVKKKMSG